MNLNMMKFTIGKQLKFSYGILIIFVIIMGVFSYYQTDKMYQNTVILYENPLQVRRAIAGISDNVNKAGIEYRDLLIRQNGSERQRDEKIQMIYRFFVESEVQIGILYDKYLGPKEDIDELFISYHRWETDLKNSIAQYNKGDFIEAERLLYFESSNITIRNVIFENLSIVDDFAKAKALELYTSSSKLNILMNINLVVFVVLILILSVIISTRVYKNIKIPIDKLNKVAKNVQKGELAERARSKVENEIGEFSRSFDQMLDSIELKSILNEKSVSLAGAMLSLDDAKDFFQLTLSTLAEHVEAQNVAVYLLSADKENYDIFESIGMSSKLRQSFNAKDKEGEFGQVLSLKKVIITTNIPKNTKFVYSATNEDYFPNEIMTIPIISNDEIIAIITLSTLTSFSDLSLELIDDILLIMSARIEGILNYQKVIQLKIILEEKNNELEIQKSELKVQSAELNKQNSELEIQKEQLSEVSQLKTNFLSNMSHELRTPLNAVIALSGILSRKIFGMIPDEEYGYLEVIERSGHKLLSLINDILDITRIESGKVGIIVERFVLSDLINEILELLIPIADSKNIEIQFEESKNRFTVESDIEKCRHILQNIISNAVKFTEKGYVSIKIIKNDFDFQVEIKDSGIGIEPNQLNHIFEQFEQADGTTTRKFGGTGLGLAIAKKYTELLDGTLTVQSVIDEGTQFVLTLPILDEQLSKKSNLKEIQNYKKKKRIENEVVDFTNINDSKFYKPFLVENLEVKLDKVKDSYLNPIILVVEDNPENMLTIRALFKGRYKHIEAVDGEEAIKKAIQYKPDLILMDIALPIMDGVEAFKCIRHNEDLKDIPVIALTASVMISDREIYLAHGFDAFIPKPIIEKQFLKVIGEVLYG